MGTLHLPLSLRMIAQHQTYCNSQFLHKTHPDPGGKMCSLVTDCLLGCHNVWKCVKRSSAVSKMVGRPVKGIIHRECENQSMMTRIAMFPQNSGRSVMKSIMTWDHGRWGSSMSKPAAKVQGILAWAHDEYEEMWLWVSRRMFGHQFFVLSRWYVFCVLGCPVAGVVWAHIMSLPQKWSPRLWHWQNMMGAGWTQSLSGDLKQDISRTRIQPWCFWTRVDMTRWNWTEQGPSGLERVKTLGGSEIFQVSMVSKQWRGVLLPLVSVAILPVPVWLPVAPGLLMS